MSIARIHSLFQGRHLIDCPPSNGTDPIPADDSDSLLINWDKQAVIGISCILGGMVVISSTLLICMKRHDPQFTFTVIFKRSNSNEPFQSAFVPELQIEKFFSDDELLEINETGEQAFMKKFLQDMIALLQTENRPVESNNLFYDVMKTMIIGKEASHLRDKWYMTTSLTIAVPQNKNKSFYLFEKILPPFMVSTSLYELVFSMPETIGSIALSPKYLPISDEANKDINYTKVFISLPKNFIFLFFLNPQVIYSASYGAMMDDKLIQFYRWLRQPNCNFMRNLCDNKNPLHGKYKLAHLLFSLLKIILLVSVVCEIDVEIESDFQNMKSINERIINNTQTGIPVWLLYFSAWLDFAHNQINDPSNMMVEFMMLLTFVNLSEEKIFTKWRINEMIEKDKSLNQDLSVSSPALRQYSKFSHSEITPPRSPNLEARLLEEGEAEFKSIHI